ncbi:hypothetical protein COCMIDRAFT_80955 [Bipolaris oryzae ATCC 44560]|uniref:Cytochrome P450 alkane hydroxylase n=1 Tax=Bipolaris oryzae ATCC 44560 TaxID=930090 RepID=W6ZL73_COCMI|nr:uncharacterized protein COCMIDRAFT_80955 [Bipolaris oryzae ATCC 44560]EUC50820.1 hypothetical protein COCMIDRAFT_80955 [Bipolaris oryzae ATCC 44560]
MLKEQDAFGKGQGCEPVPKLVTRWPLGMDLLWKAGCHVKDQTLMQFFTGIVESSGYTHEQRTRKASDFGVGKRFDNFYPLMGSSIFTQDGAEWKHSRAMLRPQLAANLQKNYDAVESAVNTLIKSIRDDTVVDLLPLFYDLALNTTLFLLFGSTMGYSQNDDNPDEGEGFADAFLVAQEFLSHRGRLGDYYWLANSRKFQRACKITHRFIDRGIDAALSDPRDDGTDKDASFCSALRRKTSDRKAIRAQCLAVLLAGRDTTACTLSWAFRLLVRHPRVLEKLRTEIESTIGLGKDAPHPTRAIMKRMPYLDAVFKEVLRLYPIAPVNGRTANCTTTLPVGGGPTGQSPFLVRKGEIIGYSVYVMHRRKDLYGEDAHEFRPERWEDGTLFRRIGYGYLPFNGGPRVCLGQEYAQLEIAYTIVRLIQNFPNMKLPVDETVVPLGMEKQALTLVLAPGDGARVHMRS